MLQWRRQARLQRRNAKPFDAACLELIEDCEVDSVLMGGTDLALVYDEETSPFPIVDCAAIHARKVVSVSLAT